MGKAKKNEVEIVRNMVKGLNIEFSNKKTQLLQDDRKGLLSIRDTIIICCYDFS